MRKIIPLTLALALSLGAAELRMATTTSTDNTGLLDALKLLYEKESGNTLKWIAVGTGAALKMGEDCNADVIFVHSPKIEKEFINKKFGVDRTPIMYNDFILIADKSLAPLFEGKNLKQSLELIKSKKLTFISRGDKSGTDNKEKSLWKNLGTVPEKESWYQQSGQGMLASIKIAEEKKGVILTDRGTYIKYEANEKAKPSLVIVSEGDESLKNFYSIIATNPKHCKNVNYTEASKFIKWLTSDETLNFIANFKLLNQPLFIVDAKTRKD
ncbi:substrate-binding domain-containing protein [Campylobacter sp. VicNov18]|uniref:tungstate ABC transporter substrate-binding protein TupA n=1 Tax=Campylobacter bilis TaxID=2691918 RepID=UPI00130DFDDC|nr:tungstate ABC transporter substrate-binding protein TupA [Campylobacter bilis]MPV63912.1 tungsten ABC transporter substrate-binding protein [Campylobacter hepaticus]MBM0637413.1 tungsten ABC transporter substrate-binding protein [Campylobacter bilis]MCC8278134.1 substrate-binding domain-containing protein [Campylobacter bilis]MCC8299638.1 substrate-binding domain-containing protein [Campylobacter bilis]MCC8301043.1 substrate-binding domain-containing protein [Campylobacter bilis]